VLVPRGGSRALRISHLVAVPAAQLNRRERRVAQKPFDQREQEPLLVPDVCLEQPQASAGLDYRSSIIEALAKERR
jgi:hypothetical protein